MVDFYVSKLKVAGFRGLREFELSFDPDLPSVVVGPNNTGKTTLLDAIGLGMGSAKFSRYDVSDGDFWQGKDGEPVEVFVIDLKFGARTGGRLPAVKGGLGNPVDVHGIRTSATLGESSVARHLVDDAGTAILLNLGTPISKGQQDDYRGMGLTGRRYATVRDVSKWMPEVWQLDTKNLFLSLYEWKSGPLQRLLAIYKEHLLSDEWTTDSGRKMPDSLGRLVAFLPGAGPSHALLEGDAGPWLPEEDGAVPRTRAAAVGHAGPQRHRQLDPKRAAGPSLPGRRQGRGRLPAPRRRVAEPDADGLA